MNEKCFNFKVCASDPYDCVIDFEVVASTIKSACDKAVEYLTGCPDFEVVTLSLMLV